MNSAIDSSYDETTLRVQKIKFTLMSPEEILGRSVAEITKPETYLGSEPVFGGLFDVRMGILENGRLCPTDQNDCIRCPGFFGHLALAKPVFFVQFMRWIVDTLRLICYRCGTPLIDRKRCSDAELQRILRFTKRIKTRVEITKLVEAHRLSKCLKCDVQQPDKYSRKDLTIEAHFKTTKSGTKERTFNMAADYVNLLFKKITDADAELLGFDHKNCRPEWMICSVLPVLPPVVRPSVRTEGSQRSEDDLTHKMVDIIKSNRDLAKKIAAGAEKDVIDTYHAILQFHIGTLIDNNISQTDIATQPNGRPLKALRQRLKGKEGRIRGNLMGKRVDFSARTVITPNPLLEIDELGVPLEICMNMTYPEMVTVDNYERLQKHVANGPNTYPGAKSLFCAREKCHNYLKYSNLATRAKNLEVGDIVMRHLVTGDPVLFNRQPSLHRMSMMCHRIQPWPGKTFQLCVDVTTPYNADFDGDEMNMHVPQSVETASEILALASVGLNLISPSNSKPVVGAVQDTLLGASLIVSDTRAFPVRQVMNLCLWNRDPLLKKRMMKTFFSASGSCTSSSSPLKKEEKQFGFVTGRELLSHIFPSDLNLKASFLHIEEGRFLGGELTKTSIKAESNGLVHTCVNDLGPLAGKCAIDNLRSLVTNYILHKGFSVGISDMLIEKDLIAKNLRTLHAYLQERISLFEKMHDTEDPCYGSLFELEENQFENKMSTQKVVDILGRGTREGLAASGKNNRLVSMVKAGSKGSDLNISQIIACVGQQSVDGKRLSMSYNSRVFPHFEKFDESPLARGFVAHSFIQGLSAEEVFGHAQGGREGLIDTAVKTSTTGYIQRRLMKLLEDNSKRYDGTVRDAANRLVMFCYGDDNLDPVKSEFIALPFEIAPPISVEETVRKTMEYKECSDSSFRTMQEFRIREISSYLCIWLTHCSANLSPKISFAANLPRLLLFVQQESDRDRQGPRYASACTPLTAERVLQDIETLCVTIAKMCPNDMMLRMMLYGYLTPRKILKDLKLSSAQWVFLLSKIKEKFYRSLIEPGDMVGVLSAQSIGEPATQLTLNTFHFAGVGQKSNVTRGVPRVNELLNLTHNPKIQTMTIALHSRYKHDQKFALSVRSALEMTRLQDIVHDMAVKFCERRGFIMILEINKQMLFDYDLDLIDVFAKLLVVREYNMDISCNHQNDDSKVLQFVIELLDKDEENGFAIFMALEKNLLSKLLVKGVTSIKNCVLRKQDRFTVTEDRCLVKETDYVIDAEGTNLALVMLDPHCDATKCTTNNVWEVYRVLGIEAARNVLIREITDVISEGSYVNPRHIELLCEMMTQNGTLTSVDRHGFSRGDIGPLAKCSFEETDLQLYKAAIFGETDTIHGVSSNIMLGQVAKYGSGVLDIYLDEELIDEKIREFASLDPSDERRIEFEKRLEKCSILRVQTDAPSGQGGCSAPDASFDSLTDAKVSAEELVLEAEKAMQGFDF